jgi:hypothetical protein
LDADCSCHLKEDFVVYTVIRLVVVVSLGVQEKVSPR